MPFVDANGETIHYLKEGDGPAVALIHSLGSSAQMWRDQIVAYKDRYTIVAIDTRGHGQSSAKGEVSVAAAAHDLKAVLDHLSIPECHLVGVSSGGLVALTFAAQNPAMVRSLVIVNTCVQPTEDSLKLAEATAEAIAYVSMEEFGRQYAAETLMPETSLDVQDELAATIAKIDPKVYTKMMHSALRGDFRSTLTSIDVPTLIVAGEGDRSLPRSASEFLVTNIAMSALQVLPAAGHLSCIDNPAAFNAVVGKFLDANRQVQ